MAKTSIGHVFMSYSRKDEAVMRRITQFLRRQGIKVWVDEEGLVPGTPIWELEIEKAIKGASAVVVLLSPDSNASVWVRRELTFAERYHKRIYPVLVAGDEDSSIMLRLSTSQYVDIRTSEELGFNSLKTALALYFNELEEHEKAELERNANERSGREAAEKVAKEKTEREATYRLNTRKAKQFPLLNWVAGLASSCPRNHFLT